MWNQHGAKTNCVHTTFQPLQHLKEDQPNNITPKWPTPKMLHSGFRMCQRRLPNASIHQASSHAAVGHQPTGKSTHPSFYISRVRKHCRYHMQKIFHKCPKWTKDASHLFAKNEDRMVPFQNKSKHRLITSQNILCYSNIYLINSKIIFTWNS